MAITRTKDGEIVGSIGGVRPSSMVKFLSLYFQEDYHNMEVEKHAFLIYVNRGASIHKIREFRKIFKHSKFFAVMGGGEELQ